MNYYNEWEPYPAQWLCNLIDAKLIPQGEVDERSISDVRPEDLSGFTQCHFFAGIAGWPLALQLAGWPEDEPVWTGSCPCQPFSVAGKRKGTSDTRHLWPEFYRLISECGPPTVFGEQVASKDGRRWLVGVRTDLEDMGYVVGAADLCAAGVGAPHRRQRLWWVAESEEERRSVRHLELQSSQVEVEPHDSEVSRLAYANKNGRRSKTPECETTFDAKECIGRMALSNGRQSSDRGVQRGGEQRQQQEDSRVNHWSAFDLVHCLDGKARRIEPGTFPLATGVSARMGKLRAYGNSIVPQVAAEFIQAYLDCRP